MENKTDRRFERVLKMAIHIKEEIDPNIKRRVIFMLREEFKDVKGLRIQNRVKVR